MSRPLLFLLVLLTACSSKKDRPVAADEPSYTVFFIDKSLSNQPGGADTEAHARYERVIREAITQHVHQKGDRVAVYFVHDNTAKARALSLTARTPLPDLEGASPTDRDAAQTDYELQLTREQATLQRQVLAKLDQPNSGSSNQHTDLWGSLDVLAQANESGRTVWAYYLSDMVESMTGPGRRDFHKTPPATTAQADEWAKTDAKLLGEQYPIGSPAVRLVLPFSATASAKENKPTITRYWHTLFEALGASGVEE
ncbi:hypothetical protein J2I47_15100 [Fibrella sp. HMF5335]|uniref:Lipoprotein n=1 Tax=Fibrella rubiginis TaxID=2817060 RepID=A0A939K3Z1_9BACT|nr:hypothetical protein [Fibrella rubiginis]MBO0937884.1 hypothetical protein [Fibrella rubiginis]